MKIEVLPNIVTSSNLLIGLLAIIYAVGGSFFTAAVLILAAALLDRFDGKLARKFGSTSDFGKELDSLADLVSFGVSPGVALYLCKLNDLGVAGIIIIMIFVLCGALRLARFNIMNTPGYYLGVPITIAGALVAGLVIFDEKVNVFFMAAIVLALSVLMISKAKMPKI